MCCVHMPRHECEVVYDSICLCVSVGVCENVGVSEYVYMYLCVCA